MAGANDIILIGMAGVGKSTAGVLLAKETMRSFADTDVMIQSDQGRTLQQIIDSDGVRAFLKIEEAFILGLKLDSHVIATGGSVVYSATAMNHLKASGPIVHLDLDLELIEKRLLDMRTRGLVISKGQTLTELYAERQPLYRRWADVTIDCRDLTQDQVVASILRKLGPRG